MDYVDEKRAKFVKFTDLDLCETEEKLVRQMISRFNNTKIFYLKIDRGLSKEKKIVIKPASLFPYLIKIGNKEEILKEHEGYQLVHLRIPPSNIPFLEDFKTIDDRAALMYRYITGGLVSDPVNRLDNYLGTVQSDVAIPTLKEILDVTMKKCHWLGGNFEMLPINLPELENPQEGVDVSIWKKLTNLYNQVKEKVKKIKAPHGIVHGDLHPKNILITRNNTPVLIDFSFVKSNFCIYIDYAKLEVYLQFQLNSQVTGEFLRVNERVYSNEPLILPRSNKAVASYIHAIRSTLWKNCLSKYVRLKNEEIDFGYRAYLLYCLIRLWSKVGNSSSSREIALKEIKSLIYEQAVEILL
ncbi:MAG TPA: phosphotransferase [Methanofastidiosum sp.]|jgi:serine/threonine protein kinase|nr:MAG: Phosphotransferase enzyme family protein [Firmicutes bacterium ADurb.Bin080]HOC78656.1 phosphotransferase [Methanofastidiosum sp.]HQK63434.1 phosphotransferase [Methanofastidiosum sp.]